MIIEDHDARNAARLAGLRSVAMIDYLERSGVFFPTRKREKNRGKRRRYTFRDVLVLKTIAVLLSNGASVANLKHALEGLQRIKWNADETVLEDSAGALRHLVVSSQRIYFARSRDELLDLAAGGQLSFSFLIDLDSIHRELSQSWRQGNLSLAQSG
ncbi:MerR family transcriptional regulator [Sphingopyxis kveilinensis]|uniref:MerR family transcriptional regulator n=1 Tax=Sphingopyxis kveilinensis TaxID=3114367 RepID=UPI0030D5369B